MRSALANVSLAYATSTSWGGDVRPALTDGAVRLAPTTGRSDSSSASPASRRSAGASTPTRASARRAPRSWPPPLRDTRECPRAAIPPPRTPPARARAARTPQPRQTPETAIARIVVAVVRRGDRRDGAGVRATMRLATAKPQLSRGAYHVHLRRRQLIDERICGEAWGVGRFSARENIL